ncbi:hypothetical protein [Actinacidiphila alni]|uniref:hypothetical protein n=1 Tax=Actinacidiphila alni TaxID=380248 RepID=UPI003454F625
MTAEHHHDAWLIAAHARALDGLAAVLDIEAGLSEVLLQSRHAALAENVALDVDAGLAAALLSPDPDAEKR